MNIAKTKQFYAGYYKKQDDKSAIESDFNAVWNDLNSVLGRKVKNTNKHKNEGK